MEDNEQPKESNYAGFRAMPALLAEIDARRQGKPRGAQARQDLERYYAALARELATVGLTESEMSLIRDASRGILWSPHSVGLLWAEIDDSLENELTAKWGVDGPALVAKLRMLTYSQSLAVCDAAEHAPAKIAAGQQYK